MQLERSGNLLESGIYEGKNSFPLVPINVNIYEEEGGRVKFHLQYN